MISRNKNFLFIHIPKTGGNSIQNILAPYADEKIVNKNNLQDGVERFEVEHEHLKINKHSSLTDYKNQLDLMSFKDLYKFSVIRNPFDRLISFYFSPHRQVNNWDKKEFIKLVESINPIKSYITLKRNLNILSFNKNKLDKDLDFLIRFENLEKDFEKVCKKLDIPFNGLPHRNKSNKENYKKYYDSELERLVLKKYKDEIEYGAYKL